MQTSEDQHQYADHHDQPDQKDDAGGLAEELEHRGSPTE
jgi:hypothetical protein